MVISTPHSSTMLQIQARNLMLFPLLLGKMVMWYITIMIRVKLQFLISIIRFNRNIFIIIFFLLAETSLSLLPLMIMTPVYPFLLLMNSKMLFFSQMNSDKSNGLNGLNPTFSKKFWHLCGAEIFQSGTT